MKRVKTRELFQEEREVLNVAWGNYLDTTKKLNESSLKPEESLKMAHSEWQKYNETLKNNGIIPTLSGYRVLLSK